MDANNDLPAPASGVSEPPVQSKRGFAAMPRERHLAIASKGGRAAQDSGVAYRFTTEEARKAGRKGGAVVSADRAHMSAIGRKGALSKRDAMPPADDDGDDGRGRGR